MTFEDAQKILYGAVVAPQNPAVHPQAKAVAGDELAGYLESLNARGVAQYQALHCWQEYVARHGSDFQRN